MKTPREREGRTLTLLTSPDVDPHSFPTASAPWKKAVLGLINANQLTQLQERFAIKPFPIDGDMVCDAAVVGNVRMVRWLVENAEPDFVKKIRRYFDVFNPVISAINGKDTDTIKYVIEELRCEFKTTTVVRALLQGNCMGVFLRLYEFTRLPQNPRQLFVDSNLVWAWSNARPILMLFYGFSRTTLGWLSIRITRLKKLDAQRKAEITEEIHDISELLPNPKRTRIQRQSGRPKVKLEEINVYE